MAQWHIEKRTHTDGKSISYRVKAEMPRDAMGKRQTKSGTFATRKEADAAGREWSRDADNGIVVKTTTATVADVVRGWLDVKRHDLKPRTLVHYEATIKMIVDRIGTTPIQKIQPAHLDALYALLRDAGKSEDALHRVHMRLAQVFDFAVKRRIIATNPMQAIEAPIARPAPAIILTAPQIRRFLAFAEECGYSPLWLLLIQTGLRRGEALGVRWQDIDLEKGKLSVHQCVEVYEGAPHIQTPKSPAAYRTITLFPESIVAIQAHRTRQLERQLLAPMWNNTDLVFTTSTGGPLNPSNVFHNLRVIQEKANRDALAHYDRDAVLPTFCIHDLRHTHATHLIRARWDIVTVSRRLGHANPAITMRIYAHALADVPDGDLVTPVALTGTA